MDAETLKRDFEEIENQPLIQTPKPSLSIPRPSLNLSILFTGFFIGILFSYGCIELITKPNIQKALETHANQVCTTHE